ncbi:MAG: hypothetical protein ABIQ95_09640 [Bdellovibrionia bacterium]
MKLFLALFFMFFGGVAYPETTNQEFLAEVQGAMESLDITKVGALFSSMKTYPLSKEDYLELISKAATPSTPPCFFNGLVNHMNTAFPQYKISDHVFGTGAIKDKGLQIILDSHLPALDHKTRYSVLSSFDTLKMKMKTAMTNDKSYGIFFHDGEKAHWSLIYLNRHLKSEDCTVQVLDAAGHMQAMQIMNALKAVLPLGCKIGYEEGGRQCDTTSCSVFAVSDFLELTALDRRPVDLCPSKYGGPQKMKLAPQLMSLVQSYNAIDRFVSGQDITQPHISDLKKLIDSTTVTLPKQPEAAKANGSFCSEDRKTYFNTEKDKTVNAGARILHDKYVKEIILKLVESHNGVSPSGQRHKSN